MNSGMKTEKRKGLRRKTCKFWGEDQTKKRIFIAKSAKNGLAHEHLVEGQYFGGVRPRTAANSSGTKPVTFFGTKSSLGGAYFLFRDAQEVIWMARPRNAPGPDVGAKQPEYAG